MDDDRIVQLLASIDRRLALLTRPQELALRQSLDTRVLRSKARAKMFDAINGERGSGEIAQIAGIGKRAVQIFVKELLDKGFIRDKGDGREVIPERDEKAITQWYLRQGGSGQA